MNGKNDELNGAAIGLGLICAALYIIFAVAAVLLGMLSFVLTCLAIVAWINDGLQLGDDYVSPENAKKFIIRGIGFAIFVPVFWALLMAFLGEPNKLSLEWLILGGYVFGSAGIEVLEAWDESQKQEASQQVILPPLPEQDRYLPPVSPPVRPREPFGYASWDDEELRP